MAYATLEQLKAYLDIAAANTDDDELLTMALDNASATIDVQTHRTYVSVADETHTFDAIRDVEGLRLWLRGDLALLTAVTNGDGQVLPPDALVTEPAFAPFYALTLKRNRGLAWTYAGDPEQAIGVLGRWAYSVAPPAPIVQATTRLAAWLYRQRENANDLDRAIIVGNATLTPSRIPADVLMLLRPYRRLVI
jgi:hypothetical protein